VWREIVQIVCNGEHHELEGETSLAAFLGGLQIEVRRVAVEINGRLVPRAEHAKYVVREGDRVEIVTLVGGG
jgi:sulfur carrier protein